MEELYKLKQIAELNGWDLEKTIKEVYNLAVDDCHKEMYKWGGKRNKLLKLKIK